MIQSGIWWQFLLIGPVVYWLLPVHWRIWSLTVASLALLWQFLGATFLPMAALALWVFFAPRLADKLPSAVGKALQTPLPAWTVFMYFVWFKYLNGPIHGVLDPQDAAKVLVPIGISYFSFKLLHYAIEQRRGNFPNHSFGDYLNWLFLAPIFTAGPIERFEHFLKERQIVAFEWGFIQEGLFRIARGLVKKFYLCMLVNEAIQRITHGGMLAMVNSQVTTAPHLVWLGLFLTLVYVYLDFSAYTDIAIGSSRLFGLKIMENFNMPYLATNLQMFWQRWHMTLANWCRTYIYMSMIGFTRNPYLAVLATFATMGLWHAASPHWVSWGIWHGLGLMWLLYWGQLSKRRKWTFFKTGIGPFAGWLLTMFYVALGGALTVFHGVAPFGKALRLMGMAFGLDLNF
jgi:alginate O-acetyltransferase complex protein AlgI